MTYVRNKEKDRANRKRWIEANPFKYRVSILKTQIKRYGLTVEDFTIMALLQDFRCAICGKVPNRSQAKDTRLHVDHDHKTGKVRGLLCWRCNVTLGSAQDSPEILERMAEYLRLTAHP